jgi:hypothetical protein
MSLMMCTQLRRASIERRIYAPEPPAETGGGYAARPAHARLPRRRFGGQSLARLLDSPKPALMTFRRFATLLPLVVIAACSSPAPAPAPSPAPAAPEPFAYADVWTRNAGVTLRRDSGSVALPYVSMRLQVLRADTAGLLVVRCIVCPMPVDGTVRREDVIYRPADLSLAAGDSLAEFVLALREAAKRRDVAALRAVMSPGFVHVPAGPDGILEALGYWQSMAYRPIEQLPALLDRGVARVPGTEVWAAPPAFGAQVGYQGPRAGFRRVGGRWQWIFLSRGGM